MPRPGLISILLLTLLSAACSTQPVPEKVTVKVPVIIYVEPPAPLMRRCVLPSPKPLITNRDLVNGYTAWRSAAKRCDARQQRLINWIVESAPDKESGDDR
ncbi:Rz1-like lysis system protein LysC [Kushneria sp. Sum13]|uniref:Rz1-like lysis system protein LysC n=1 Tax=Kushneria sp. Sum13 TaxID=3459196 RepID=UPI00404660AF